MRAISRERLSENVSEQPKLSSEPVSETKPSSVERGKEGLAVHSGHFVHCESRSNHPFAGPQRGSVTTTQCCMLWFTAPFTTIEGYSSLREDQGDNLAFTKASLLYRSV